MLSVVADIDVPEEVWREQGGGKVAVQREMETRGKQITTIAKRLEEIAIRPEVVVARGDARHLIPFFARKWSSDLIFVRAHVQKDFAELLRDHKTAARTARWALSVARAAVDAPTEDLLTQRVMAHERAAWMLRSMLVKSAPSLTKERLG